MKKNKEVTKVKFKDKSTLQKVWTIVSTTVVILFAAIALVVLPTSIAMKAKGQETLTIGNKEIRLVLTDSMMWDDNTPESHKGFEFKNIDQNDAVVITKAPQSDEELKAFHEQLNIGDVVTINYVESGKPITVTHRIITKENYGNGYHFILQGDNYSKGTPSTQHVYTATDMPNPYPVHTFVGKVTSVSSFLGSTMNFSRNKIVIISLILAPAVAVIVYEVIKIIMVVEADKKEKLIAQVTEKTKEEMNNQNSNQTTEDEVERLKKLLEEKEKELEKQKQKK